MQVFVSYAHEDRRHLDQFRVHIADLRRTGVEVFDDQAIMPGERWEQALTRMLDRAGHYRVVDHSRIHQL